MFQAHKLLQVKGKFLCYSSTRIPPDKIEFVSKEHRIIESLRSENASKLIESNIWLITILSTRPWHKVPPPATKHTEKSILLLLFWGSFLGCHLQPLSTERKPPPSHLGLPLPRQSCTIHDCTIKTTLSNCNNKNNLLKKKTGIYNKMNHYVYLDSIYIFFLFSFLFKQLKLSYQHTTLHGSKIHIPLQVSAIKNKPSTSVLMPIETMHSHVNQEKSKILE